MMKNPSTPQFNNVSSVRFTYRNSLLRYAYPFNAYWYAVAKTVEVMLAILRVG
jgi:hypothetical protein